VLAAVCENQFYIFSHPGDRWAMERRAEQIRAAFDDADNFNEEKE
jgi:hypothetical protein